MHDEGAQRKRFVKKLFQYHNCELIIPAELPQFIEDSVKWFLYVEITFL